MTLVLTIGPTNATGYLQVNSLNKNDELGSRLTLSFTLRDPVGSYRPALGASVSLTRDGTTIFAGSIDQYDESQDMGSTTPANPNGDLVCKVTCVDNCAYADRHHVAAEYVAQTFYAIIADIVATYLAADGITTTHVMNPGPTIDDISFNYDSCSRAFDTIAQQLGYVWYIDFSKDLHFGPPGNDLAPIVIGEYTQNFRNIVITHTRNQYRNREYICGGYNTTSSRTEVFLGDGVRTTFGLQYAVATTPVVTLNGGAQTVGIQGIDTGNDWYWNKESKDIVQDDGGTPISAGDTLAVTYIGLFKAITCIEDAAEVAKRAAAEGDSGIYEDVVTDTQVESAAEGIAEANAYLKMYANLTKLERVSFQTDYDDLRSGQLITVVRKRPLASSAYMITQVQTIDLRLGSVAPTMRYNVVAVGGVFRETWFRQLGSVLSASTPNKKGILRSTDKVNLGQRNRVGARCGDDLSVNAAETLPCIGSAMIDSSTPSTNYGGEATGSAGTYFDVAGSKRKTECYLDFGDLSHLIGHTIGHTIVSAKLRIWASSFRAAPVQGVSDRAWDSTPGASETRVKFGFYLSELPTSEVPLISWGGIVVKGDSAGNVKLYLDGVLKITIGGYNGPTFIGLRAGLWNGQGYYNRVEAALETVLGNTYVKLVVYNGFALSSQSQPVGGLSFIWNELCYFDPALVLRAFPDCYAYTNGSGTSFVYTYTNRGSSSVPDGTAATYVMLAFGTDVGPPLPLSLYSASQGSWAESSVTWLNRPNIHTGLGLTENVNPSPGGPGAVVQALVEFDLTGQFQAALYLGYIDMTFLVAGPGDIYTCTGVDDPPSVFVDLRTGGTPPELVVEYEA